MRKFNVVIFGKLPGKIKNFFWMTKIVACMVLERKIKKNWYNGQKGKCEIKMICNGFMGKNFFKLADLNIKYSPTSLYKSNNFDDLQEVIPFVFL